jgi:hypothetical protein
MYVSIWLSNHFSSYWTYYSVTNRIVWESLDLNQRPLLYESTATNQLSYIPILVFSLPLDNHIAIPVLLPGAYHLRGVITTLKFDSNSLKLLHPCHALVNKVLVELVSKSYRFFVPSMYIMSETDS